jgi:hypothetical protein
MRRFSRAIWEGSVIAALCLLLALTVVAGAAGRSTGKPKATVKWQGKTYAFAGGRCKHILDGFNLTIGNYAGSKYFTLQESRTLKAGTYRQAVLGFHLNGKYYDTKSMTLTIANGARKGTFSGKLKNTQTGASAGTFKGSFSC